jgi:hypothetical protein
MLSEKPIEDVDNRVLRKIFGPEEGGRPNIEELRNLYVSPNIITMMKSKGMRWVAHLARVGKTRNTYNILVGKSEGARPLGTTRLDGKIILKCILGKYSGKVWIGCIWIREGTSGGPL